MYQTYNISSLAEVPPIVKAFAGQNGWATSGLCVITRPGGGEAFSMQTDPDQDSGRQKLISITRVSNPTKGVRTQSPVLGAAPTVYQPTKLYLFGGTEEDTTYIAGVIEYGFNLYRHFYIGNMVKIGNYQGGECISMNRPTYFFSQFGANAHYGTDAGTRFMFSASQNVDVNFHIGGFHFSGGVNIVHPDNPVSWRAFYASTAGNQAFAADTVVGGIKDGTNGGLASKARSNYAGAAILVPVQLYVPDVSNSRYDTRFRPIGYPAGCRIVSMENLAQGQEIEVGNKHWRVFPEFAKQTDATANAPAGQYLNRESSFYAGMAYLVD